MIAAHTAPHFMWVFRGRVFSVSEEVDWWRSVKDQMLGPSCGCRASRSGNRRRIQSRAGDRPGIVDGEPIWRGGRPRLPQLELAAPETLAITTEQPLCDSS
jgi:hypothetical protein